MKQVKYILLLCIPLAFFLWGTFVRLAPVEAEETETVVSKWVVLDETTSSGTEPTALTDGTRTGERTLATIKAAITAAASGDDEISIYAVSTSSITKANIMRFRCIGITDGSSVAYDIHAATVRGQSDADFTYVGTLTFTIGTQASTVSTYEFADTVAVTDGDTIATWSSSSPENNRIAEAGIDFFGADTLVLVPKTAACDCKLLGKVL